MTGVERALLDAAAAGVPVSARDLGDPSATAAELERLAATPAAPLAAAALVAALADDSTWAASAERFARAMSGQSSVLALAESVDVLLADPAAAAVTSAAMHDALVEGVADLAAAFPSLAGARLEAALRVALSGRARPYLVLDRFSSMAGAEVPEELADALPRLIGIALDAWPAENGLTAPLVEALESLRATPAEADAAHELACHRMRRALETEDGASAVAGLRDCARLFDAVRALDGSRDDAAAYGAACRAAVAFAAGDPAALSAAADEMATAMVRRDAWHLRAHVPAWRAGARDAETAWLALVLDMRAASERLSEGSWLDAAAAVGEVARVYEADRTVAPGRGLAAAFRPFIDNAVAARAALFDQLSRAVAADARRPEPLLPAAAGQILAAARRRRDDSDAADAEADPAAVDRVRRVAPALLVLGDGACGRLALLSDAELAQAGALLAGVAPQWPRHPALELMREAVLAELERNPLFVGVTRAAVVALLETTLTFLLDRYDRGGPLVPGGKDITGPLSPQGPVPVEADLQYQFHMWLASRWEFAGRVGVEASDVATGRADVIVRFGAIVLVTEVKRELVDASPAELERLYLPQAAQYSGSNVPFSQLLVLDLTDHSAGVRPLQDLAWARERKVSADASAQHVVVAVVVGNRPTPRALRPLAQKGRGAGRRPRGAKPKDG